MVAQLIASGLALGSIYALLALSLILINKATDGVNFAQGEMAMFGTFICFALLTKAQMPLVVVLMLVAPIGALLGIATERIAMRPLQAAPQINALIATIGLWMIFHHKLIAALESLGRFETGLVPPLNWSESYHGGPRTFGYAVWKGGKLSVIEGW
jgi:branched-subunit amino acid ABC-type transport system permease component